MVERAKLSDYMISIGSTKASKPEEHIVEEYSDAEPEIDSDSCVDHIDEEEDVLLNDLCDGMNAGGHEPDDVFVSAANARKVSGC